MVRSASRTAEQTWTLWITTRLDPPTSTRLLDLIATEAEVDSGANDDGTQDCETVLGLIKSTPGNVSLKSMMTEVSKLEAPSHLRRHREPLTLTLLAALVHQREREATHTLVELLIVTVHRIGAHAERRVTDELVNAFERVSGKENVLLSMAEAALENPDGAVRAGVFPAVTVGEQMLRELVHEFKTKGSGGATTPLTGR